MNKIILFIFIIIGYLIYKKICVYGDKKNECPYKFNRLKNIHIHHWIFHLIIIVILIKNNVMNPILLGLNIGGLMHGIIEYNDWYIIYK